MSNILTLFKKELRSYFNSPIAYIFIIVFLVITNWMFFGRFFLVGEVTMRPFFDVLPWIFLILLPALSMRVWAEEKRSGSMELLLTLPIQDWQAVAGKFLAVVTFLLFALLLTLSTTLTVFALGEADGGEIISGYVGAVLFGGAALAFGSFLSSLTKNQIVAFLITAVGLFAFIIIGQDYVLIPVSGIFASIVHFLSLSSHYNVIARGLLDMGDIVYLLGFIFFFLFLNTKVLQSRYYK